MEKQVIKGSGQKSLERFLGKISITISSESWSKKHPLETSLRSMNKRRLEKGLPPVSKEDYKKFSEWRKTLKGKGTGHKLIDKFLEERSKRDSEG